MARSILIEEVTTTPTRFDGVSAGVNAALIFNNGAETIYFAFDEATGDEGLPILAGAGFSYSSSAEFQIWLTAASGTPEARILVES